ncbi:DUF6370 family protein [Pedobacter cryotolerans]|nr:DUF6370 family protein [Pedobacter cryotolerans]
MCILYISFFVFNPIRNLSSFKFIVSSMSCLVKFFQKKYVSDSSLSSAPLSALLAFVPQAHVRSNWVYFTKNSSSFENEKPTFALIMLTSNVKIMKALIVALLLTSFGFAANAQTKPQPATKINNKIVEIACGECKFDMKGKSCDLAIRIDGKSYFVDGKNIDDFGDAHDEKHGFCNVISKAKVSGEIVDGRFKAKKVELLPAKN